MTIVIDKRAVLIILALVVIGVVTWMIVSYDDNAEKVNDYHDCVTRIIRAGHTYTDATVVCDSRLP